MSIRHKNYTWLKLKANDKRALILGDMTHCCQSINGHSEQCVMDAVSLSETALYILCDKSKVIGQAYVWLSKTGNLCLDSIECLSYSITDEDLRKILTQFAEEIIANTSLKINRVTIGIGGKTPENIYPAILINEVISQGYQYGDSKRQYLIAKKQILMQHELELLFESNLSSVSEEVKECLIYLLEHVDVPSDLIAFLQSSKSQIFIESLNKNSLMRLIYLAPNHQVSIKDFSEISASEFAIFPEDEKLRQLSYYLWNKSMQENILAALPYLTESQVLYFLYEKNTKHVTLLEELLKDNELFPII